MPSRIYAPVITPAENMKPEFARFAQAAYAKGHKELGHKLSAAAALPYRAEMSLRSYYDLAEAYRAWLVFDEYPEA